MKYLKKKANFARPGHQNQQEYESAYSLPRDSEASSRYEKKSLAMFRAERMHQKRTA